MRFPTKTPGHLPFPLLHYSKTPAPEFVYAYQIAPNTVKIDRILNKRAEDQVSMLVNVLFTM